MKLSLKMSLAVGILAGISTTVSLGFQVPAQAGWNVGDVCLGFGCNGESILVPDLGIGLDEWIVDRWNEIGEAPESAVRVCGRVGINTCTDPKFIRPCGEEHGRMFMMTLMLVWARVIRLVRPDQMQHS